MIRSLSCSSFCRLFFWCAVVLSAVLVHASGVVHVVEPGPAEAVSVAIAKAKPGDIVQLRPGVYTGTIEVRVSGEPDRPIVIAGLEPGATEKAVIDGGASPGRRQNNQAFRIDDASWITVRDLEIRNAWTDVFLIQNSSYISIQGCDIRGGMHVVAVRGAATHHILAEGCVWVQEEAIYSGLDWAELHHGELVHYNGGFYGGSGADAAGGAVIRRNKIGYAFNGIRWWLGNDAVALRQAQSNIEIYENDIHHIRDNAIEPERFTWNLHVYHNRLDSCPRGVVSIDDVTGGEILFYGNTGRWVRDGAEEARPWTVYKFHNYGQKAELDHPLRLYNNSWFYGMAFARGSRVRKANDHVIHFNNAYAFVPDTDQNGNANWHMGLADWPGKHSQFDYDMAAAPWHATLIEAGFEKNGFPDTDPSFRAAADNDFRLTPESPARGVGKVIEDFHLWHLGDGPDIGAYQGEQRTYGLPFVYREPPGGALYEERPRVVRVFGRGDKLVVFYSTPLDAATLDAQRIRLNADGRAVTVRDARIPSAEHAQAVVLTLAGAPPVEATTVEFESHGGVRGVNGQSATHWGADTRHVRIPDDAVLVGAMKAILGDG